jgi:pSer/pThr/pTyr-binding forkhead associated (FHA) protein
MGAAPQAPMGGVVCSCGTPNVPGAQFCENCGKSLGAGQASAAPQTVMSVPGGSACPGCGQQNVAGAQFCENCGRPLGGAPLQQQQPPPQQQYVPPVQQQYVPPAQQQYVPPVQQQVPSQQQYGGAITGRLVVQSTNATVTIPQGKPEIIIGREDPVSGVFPDVNLDPFGGHDSGVGRRHARMTLQGGRLVLIDLDTVNGTFVNKQKLMPNSPHPVNSGDELRFGRLVTIYYA